MPVEMVPKAECSDGEGVIYLNGNITNRTHTLLFSALQHYMNNDVKTVWIVVNSLGGDTSSSFLFYELTRNLPLRINTFAAGNIASAATTIFLSGHERVISTSTSAMIHPSSFVVSVTAQSEWFKRQAEALSGDDAAMLDIVTNVTKTPKEKFLTYMNGADRYMDHSTMLDLKMATSKGTVPFKKGNGIVEVHDTAGLIYWSYPTKC